MSKINELVEKLCPNGVEFKPIWSVTIWDKKFNGVEKFKQNKVISYKYFLATDFNKIEDSKGNIKYISTGISQEDRYTTEELAGDYLAEGEIVCIPWGGTPNIKYHKGKFVTGDNRIATSADTNILDNKYLYYWMCFKIKEIESFYRGSGIKHPNMKSVLDMTIAVPPLEVQDEIVHILDDFTLLSAELSAELKAREKQYNFYKNELLSKECVKRVNLGSLCKVITKGTTPSAFSKEGITFIKTEAFENGNINKNKLSFISEEIHNGKLKRSILEENDILFTIAGATIGKMAVVTKDLLPANTNQALAIIRLKEGINMKYIKFILSSNYMKVYIQRCVKGSAQPNLNLQQLNEFEFPFPDDEKQKEIVNVLEKLDIYTHDILCGLPAEIDARQKQYEYYRDKLLNFKELVNEG